MSRYELGTKLIFKENKREGVVVSSERLPPYKIYLKKDICVEWDSPAGIHPFVSTYDDWFLDENCEILDPDLDIG